MTRYVIPFLVLAAGCTQTKSSDVASDAIFASIGVTATGDGTSLVHTELKTGGATSNNFLVLSEGDALLATGGSDSRVLQKGSELGAVWYDASFPTDAADTKFKVSFIRGSASGCQTASAPDSEVTLPAPFTLTGPAAAAQPSRAHDAIAVGWNGAGSDPTLLRVDGPCIQEWSAKAEAQATSYAIPAGAIHDAPLANYPDGGAPAPQNCQVTLTVERDRTGQLDKGFGAGGGITARQVRTVSFTSMP